MTSEFERKDHQLYWERSDDAVMPRSSLKGVLNAEGLRIYIEDMLDTDRLYYYEDSPSRGLIVINKRGDVVNTYRFE